jgi:Adaptor complexes medium subunit family
VLQQGKAVELEDIKFHQCVRLARFENDRTISFVPPDGEFDLMTYRLATHVKPLIWVEVRMSLHTAHCSACTVLLHLLRRSMNEVQRSTSMLQ